MGKDSTSGAFNRLKDPEHTAMPGNHIIQCCLSTQLQCQHSGPTGAICKTLIVHQDGPHVSCPEVSLNRDQISAGH